MLLLLSYLDKCVSSHTWTKALLRPALLCWPGHLRCSVWQLCHVPDLTEQARVSSEVEADQGACVAFGLTPVMGDREQLAGLEHVSGAAGQLFTRECGQVCHSLVSDDSQLQFTVRLERLEHLRACLDRFGHGPGQELRLSSSSGNNGLGLGYPAFAYGAFVYGLDEAPCLVLWQVCAGLTSGGPDVTEGDGSGAKAWPVSNEGGWHLAGDLERLRLNRFATIAENDEANPAQFFGHQDAALGVLGVG